MQSNSYKPALSHGLHKAVISSSKHRKQTISAPNSTFITTESKHTSLSMDESDSHLYLHQNETKLEQNFNTKNTTKSKGECTQIFMV